VTAFRIVQLTGGGWRTQSKCEYEWIDLPHSDEPSLKDAVCGLSWIITGGMFWAACADGYSVQIVRTGGGQ
jgi:hypothetical protein